MARVRHGACVRVSLSGVRVPVYRPPGARSVSSGDSGSSPGCSDDGAERNGLGALASMAGGMEDPNQETRERSTEVAGWFYGLG